jgi:protein-disulfide isomerase
MTQTKRELREERRAIRVAAEREAAVATARRRRLGMLGGAVAVAAVVVAIAAIVSSSSGTKSASAGATPSTVVAGIPEHNGVLGNPNAPYTVTEYLDLQCPICKAASTQVLPTLIDNYVKTGKVKLQARTLHFIGDDSTTAAQVAAGAEQQGKLWPFIETFYANQGEENSGYVTDGFLRDVAKAAGVNADQAFAYAKTDGAQSALDTADSDASAVGANSTPTFTIKKGDGAEKTLSVGLNDLQPLLEKAIAR